MQETGSVFYENRLKMFVYTLACILALLYSLFIITGAIPLYRDYMIGAVILGILSAIALLMFFPLLLQLRPAVIVSHDGLVIAGTGLIPWDQVNMISLREGWRPADTYINLWMLRVDIKDPARFWKDKKSASISPSWYEISDKLIKKVRFYEIHDKLMRFGRFKDSVNIWLGRFSTEEGAQLIEEIEKYHPIKVISPGSLYLKGRNNFGETKCPSCGKAINDHEAFCKECAKALRQMK